jgi:hypothetical protein
MQLDGKVSNVLFSTINNLIILIDLKTMIMSFIVKIVNPIPNPTPFDLKSILEQQQPLVTKSPMVEPTLNIGGGLVLFIGDGAHFTMDFSVDNGDEKKKTHSKGKGDGIINVATLVLGSRPRQRGCKGAGQREARESHQGLPGV